MRGTAGHATDLTDEHWALAAPFILPQRLGIMLR